MTAEKINTILTNGEGLKTEFKLAENDLPNNLFESICAFLNTQGGKLFWVFLMMELLLVLI